MSAQAVKSVYMATCDSLGIEAVSAVISSGSTFGSAGAVASGTATTVKAGLGIKLGITAIALLTAGGIMVAVLHNMNSNSSQEPVAVVEQEAESEEQSASETQTEESLYNESIPMEGLYKYGVYTISITNATVEDNRNATFDMELTYTNPETKEVETVLVTSVKKENGIAAIDATSSLGNRWFGSLMFLYDDSIRLNLSKQDTEGSVWDIMWDGSVVILTKAAADEIIQDRMLEEGIYSYTEGSDAAMDGGYILTISNVDANSFVMKLEIISDGGNKVDQLETDNEWVFMNNGIATFTGKTGWNVGMQGYLYANEDGSISLSYTATDGADEVPWYGAYPDGCLKPITLQKK